MARRKGGKRSPNVPFEERTAPPEGEPRPFRLWHGKGDLGLLAAAAVAATFVALFPAMEAAWRWASIAFQVACPAALIILALRRKDDWTSDPWLPAAAGMIYIALVAYHAASGTVRPGDAFGLLSGALWMGLRRRGVVEALTAVLPQPARDLPPHAGARLVPPRIPQSMINPLEGMSPG